MSEATAIFVFSISMMAIGLWMVFANVKRVKKDEEKLSD